MSSKLGRFIKSKSSWTMPDTRPKDPMVIRSKLGQMRVQAEGFYDTHVQDNPQRLGALKGKSSRPGSVGGSKQFRMSREEDSSGYVRNKTKRMRFGPWDK